MSILKSLHSIIGKSVFIIPDYQRSFSWEDKQIEDLIEDIKGSKDEELRHYLGQIILRNIKKIEDYNIYELIDGQQRMISLLLFLYSFCKTEESLIRHITIDNEVVKKKLKTEFGVDANVRFWPILIPSAVNQQTFFGIFNGKQSRHLELKTNAMLVKAYDCLQHFVANTKYDSDVFWKLVNDILLIVKFDVEEEKLIDIDNDYTVTKIFLAINDRGKPLGVLDRLKGLLMFYDAKKLKGSLKHAINEGFANIFEKIDYIISKEKVVNSLKFDEGSLLNYYYHTVWKYYEGKYDLSIAYDYDKSVETIYKDIRDALKSLDGNNISNFITDFVSNFKNFANSFKDILYQEDNIDLKLMIYMQEMNVRLYPLTIALYLQGNLDSEFLKLIETAGIYVYARRQPEADIYRDITSEVIFAKTKPNESKDILKRIKSRLKKLIHNFKTSCEDKHVKLTKYILWHYEKSVNGDFDLLNLSLYEDIEIEHILSQQYLKDGRYSSYGFKNLEEYEQAINKIGNLTILELALNKKARAKSPKEKADIYIGHGGGKPSALQINRDLAHAIKHQYNGFSKSQVQERTKVLLDFVDKKWPLLQ